MTDNHPITPPPELVRKWATANGISYEDLSTLCQSIATQAAQWGADEELQACCEWADATGWYGAGDMLCAARRRRSPPSLKTQALECLKNINDACESEGFSRSDDLDIIRRALESLP